MTEVRSSDSRAVEHARNGPVTIAFHSGCADARHPQLVLLVPALPGCVSPMILSSFRVFCVFCGSASPDSNSPLPRPPLSYKSPFPRSRPHPPNSAAFPGLTLFSCPCFTGRQDDKSSIFRLASRRKCRERYGDHRLPHRRRLPRPRRSPFGRPGTSCPFLGW